MTINDECDPLPQPAADKTQFLNSLRDLVLTETAAQRKQIHAIWEKPLATRAANGYAIENVSLKEMRKGGLFELSCSRNISRFRPGDILCLSQNDPFHHDSIMVNLVEDDETELLISCDDPIDWDKMFGQKHGWTLDIGFINTSSYIISALAEAGDSLVGREMILRLLMGNIHGLHPCRSAPIYHLCWAVT